jgi:1-acyl-sn-glycerol-3-phosphate acyltransferase
VNALQWLLIAGGVWLVWARIAWVLWHNPREGSVGAGLFWWFERAYTRQMHSPTYLGTEHLPKGKAPGPLVIVANHTAGIDPLLIQAIARFEIRWVMASDMRHPLGEAFWDWSQIIFVDRTGKDATGVREAIRHVQGGGVLGLFPEGGIERPQETLKPFQPGIGLIIKRTKAPVLPVIIRGTPEAASAWGSLIRPSRSRIEFLPLMDLSQLDAGEIASTLERVYRERTGWPMQDAPLAP